MNHKPWLAVVSVALPFPGSAGQQQRVLYKLKALREKFHTTFITVAPAEQMAATREKLLALCDDVILLPSRYGPGSASKVVHRIKGALHTARTGLKFSNYIIGRLELTPERMNTVLQTYQFDGAVFEYWHAAAAVPAFQATGIPCILDMHNILWQSYTRQLALSRLPGWWQKRLARLYRQQEERAWKQFDALITINAGEYEYVCALLPHKPLFYAPMGVNLALWSYSWQPARPPRIAYYGGLGSRHNQADAMRCYEAIMPVIWQQFPEAELWLVGSNPPGHIRGLPAQDRRVRVTGFVRDVAAVLKSMSLVLCPWTGRYGFRGRLVEVMALGVPVVATPDAVYGMGLQAGRGLFLEESNQALAQHALRLLDSADWASIQSQQARQQVEQLFSFENTYGKLASDLHRWLAGIKDDVTL